MIARVLRLIIPLVVLPVALWAAEGVAPKTMDSDRSVLTVRVFKAGLFSVFGHEHEISAPIQQGSFTEENPWVELTVDARKLRVMDKEVSDKDRVEIQNTMLGPEVLDSEKYPEIHFRSTQVDRLGEDKWMVRGNLTVRGQTRPLSMQVQGQSGHYRGSAELKQKDFGITPVTVGGGTVRVKNELRVEFEICGK